MRLFIYMFYLKLFFLLNFLCMQTVYASAQPLASYSNGFIDRLTKEDLNFPDETYDTVVAFTFSFDDVMAQSINYTLLDIGSVREGYSIHISHKQIRLDVAVGNKTNSIIKKFEFQSNTSYTYYVGVDLSTSIDKTTFHLASFDGKDIDSQSTTLDGLLALEENSHSAIGMLRWNAPGLNSDQATYGNDLERLNFRQLDNAILSADFYYNHAYKRDMQVFDAIQHKFAIPEPRFYGIFLGLFSISTVFHFRKKR